MSCLSRHGGDDGNRQNHAPPPADSGAPALDLLDEYWFFSNTLVKNNNGKGATSTRMMSKGQQGGGKGSAGTSRFNTSWCQRLLRTPSLPSPRIGTMEISKEDDDHQQVIEVDDDDLNWSSIYEGVLRTRIAQGSRSAMHRAPSMPVPSPAMDHDASATKSTPSMPRLRHSYSTLERQCRSHTPTKRTSVGGEARSVGANQQPVVVRSKSAFQDKKWKSSSDLESIEVQGFKDLGFVFDKEELRENLADVLPGLRRSTSIVRRPYLSEAWQHVQRSAPPALIRVQSAAEMKDQLRMWAQAVACNVRQE